MYLVQTHVFRYSEGFYEVGVIIVNEEKKTRKFYTYTIPTEKVLRDFTRLYRHKKNHGKALQTLKKNDITQRTAAEMRV